MRKLIVILLAGACCMIALPALASPMDLWVTSYPNLPAVNSNYGYFLAGPLDAYYGPAPANINGTHIGPVYCIDLYHDIVTDPDEYAVTDNVNTLGNFYSEGQPDRTGDLTQVAWLMNNYATTTPFLTDPYYQGSMQVAIWSILYPTYQYYYGLTDLNEVNFLVSASSGQHASEYEWYDYEGDAQGGQSVIRAVPEPASLFLLGSGLVGLAFIRRRRK